MTRRQFTFTLELEVYDEDELREAARQRALADGVDEADWLESRLEHGGVEYDLVMLLDPGSLVGCSIHNSYAEEI